MLAILKYLIFAIPYMFYAALKKEHENFDEFANEHTEEVTAGIFAGAASLFDAFKISNNEVHDIFITVIRTIVASIVGYLLGCLIKLIKKKYNEWKSKQ